MPITNISNYVNIGGLKDSAKKLARIYGFTFPYSAPLTVMTILLTTGLKLVRLQCDCNTRVFLRFCSNSRELRTSRSHVTKFPPSALRLKFVFGREEGGFLVSHSLQGFFAFVLKQFV